VEPRELPVTAEEIRQCQELLWKLERHGVIGESLAIPVADIIHTLEMALVAHAVQSGAAAA
jgi:hypothetical protein